MSLGFDELLEAIEELLDLAEELDATLLDDLTLLEETLEELTLDDELFAELEEMLLEDLAEELLLDEVETEVSFMQRTGRDSVLLL